MIFCTVGTEKFPFDRLVREVDRIASVTGERVFVQLGASGYIPRHCRWERYLPFEEMRRRIGESRLTLAHAGAGIFLLCTSLHKVPIMIPRLRDFKEHVNNHQLDFCRKLESMGKAMVAYDESSLQGMITDYDRALKNLSLADRRSGENLGRHLDRIVRGLRRD